MTESNEKLSAEQQVGRLQGLLLGLQHVFVSNVWLDPLFIIAMIGMTPIAASNLMNAVFIAAGAVTLTQATRLARLPIVQGPSASFDTLIITTGKAQGLSAAACGILVSAGIVFLLSITGLIGKLRHWFTPAVSGTVICIVGIVLTQFTMYEFLGGAPGTEGFLSSSVLTLSIATAVIVVVLTVFGKGWWKKFAFLIGLAIGDLMAWWQGGINFSNVKAAPWFGLPDFMPYGSMTWDTGVVVAFMIAYMAAIIEAMGVYQAAAEIIDIDLDNERIRRGFAGESAGSILSSFLGGLPTTAYAQNVGLLQLTRSGSRYPVIWAGGILLVLGFVPKAGALLALTPGAVVGGLFLPAAAGLFMSGISLLMKMDKTEANLTVVGLSLLIAIGLPSNLAALPGFWGTLLSNSIIIGACSVLTLQLLFVQLPGRLRKNEVNMHTYVKND